MHVMLVCSSGGHLAQLHRLGSWWKGHDRLWVTFDTVDARSLLAGERVEWAHHPTTRSVPNALRNLRLARRLIDRERPDLVVSDGAGVAVPFFVAARRAGVKTAFIEVYDRIDSRTLTGRLVYPLADLFCVQWEAQKALYPRAELVGRLL
jgi:UDP-N-acetylglucosamine:LPS N-acetylglucosamine transferase